MQYAWLILSLMLLFVWLVIFSFLKSVESRKEMLIVSSWTSLLGLTEPLFVPEYWNPPSLFDLALKTGFDIESLIFAFAVGGIGAVMYEAIFRSKHIKISALEQHSQHHRFHYLVLASAPLAFVVLLITTNFNPIYSAIIALVIGFLTSWYCRPDLVKKMIVSGLLFAIIYFIAFSLLNLFFPGYTKAVWNLSALSGIIALGVPVEELLWAFTFGLYWSNVYEHLGWYKLKN